MKQNTFGIQGGKAASANSILLKSLLLLLFLAGGMMNGAWADTYTYKIINNRGTLATHYTVTDATAGQAPSLPSIIRSPLLADGDFQYYTESNITVSGSTYTVNAGATPITVLPASGATIYVTYTYTPGNGSVSLDLSGATKYYIKAEDPLANNANDFQQKEIYLVNEHKDLFGGLGTTTYGSGQWWPGKYMTSKDGATRQGYLWHLEGEDPYDIYIKSDYPVEAGKGTGGYLGANNDSDPSLAFFNKGESGNNSGKDIYSYFLNADGDLVVGNDKNSSNNLYRVGKKYTSHGGRAVAWNRTVDGNYHPLYNFIFIKTPSFWYYVKTHVTGTTLSAINERAITMSSSLQIPDKLKRKYCSYEFYTDESFSEESRVTTYQDVVNAVGTTSEDYKIYVKYTVNESAMPFQVGTSYDDATWYRLYENNTGKYLYSNNNNTGSLAKGTDNTYTALYLFAFVGDPYELRIYNMQNGSGRYLSYDNQTNEDSYNNKSPQFNNKAKGYWELYDDGYTDDGDKKYFALRLAGTTTAYPITSNDNPLQMSKTKTVAKFSVAEGKKFNYKFIILDRQGRVAMQYTTNMSMALGLNYNRIPEPIRSEYIKDETLTFYSAVNTGSAAEDGRIKYTGRTKTSVAPTPADLNTTEEIPIWVTYTTNHLAEKDLHLRGVRAFEMSINGSYAYAEDDDTELKKTDTYLDEQKYWWHVVGGDPYAVQVQNVAATTNEYLNISINTTTTPPTVSQSMGVNTNLTSFFVLMKSSVADDADETITMGVLPVAGANVTYNSDFDKYLRPTEIKLVSRKKEVTYYLIDRKGKLLLKSDPVATYETLIPDDIRSPFLGEGQYHYFDVTHVTNTAGTYTNDGTELTSATDATTDIIYVFYDACNELSMYSGTQDNERTNVLMYLLKYDNGETYYQEDGADGFNNVATKAVYPYNNGELNLYVYGQEHFDKQMAQGASTRSRWGWFLQSENNDPYHVKIQSNQNQSTTNSIMHRAYLRSYTPAGYDQVVTGAITDNPRATTTSSSDWDTSKWGAAPDIDYSGGSANNVPTEYMLLGASENACKLVTTYILLGTGTNETTYGTSETDYDVTQHYTVHSFEQYWKNNPTVLNLVYEHNGATTNEEKTAIQTRLNSSGLTNAEKVMLRSRGWHSYNAWANINSWASTSGKTYQYTEHWFQTIEMGETFSFVPFSIDPAIILLDQHGWEIARISVPKWNAADRETKMQKLAYYDSPMVKAYHWWTSGAKAPGYHKYTVSDPAIILYNRNSSNKYTDSGERSSEYMTTTTLKDYPYDHLAGLDRGYDFNSTDADKNKVDLYVTYEVKDEYKSSYIGSDNEEYVSPSEFLVRQGTNYAVASGSETLTASTDPGTYLANGEIGQITNAMKWLLKPNFNIDHEMGYHYAGETGAQESALSQPETETENYTSRDADVTDMVNGRNGFDPYNLQIQNVEYGTYLTTSLTSTVVNTAGGFTGSYGNGNTLTLSSGTDEVNAVGHDQVTLNITNTVFMAVQDANGNMRLMPRFDHDHVVANFGIDNGSSPAAATVTQAEAQPADDQSHNQTTLLQIPKQYTYIVVDNNGNEALRFISTDGEVKPTMKPRFVSPFAKDFKFYSEATQESSTYTVNTTDTIASLGKHILTGDIIYVRYSYDPKADNMALLSGGRFTMKVNGQDVQLSASNVIGGTLADSDPWKWRTALQATTNPDPYSVQLYNLSTTGSVVSINSQNRFVLLPYNSEDEKYALVVPTSGTCSYDFVDGTNIGTSATTTNVAAYATATTPLQAEYQVEFTPIVPSKVTYIIITNLGHVALTGNASSTEMAGNHLAALPAWMATPIMKSSAYRYYSKATTAGGVTTVNPDYETFSVLNLENDNTIYVRYDYNADTRQAVYTGRDGINGPYLLDLSGKQSYLLSSYCRYYRDDNLTESGTRTIAITDNDDGGMNIKAPLSTRPLWLLEGDDPYEITIHNKHFDPENKKIYAKTPTESDKDPKNTTYASPLKVYTDAEASAEGYTYSTFMLLPCNFYQSNGSDAHEDAGHPSLAVTGQENWVVSRPDNSNDVMRVYQRTDRQKYRATYTEKTNPGKVLGHVRFEFVPIVEYHIVTNEGNEALTVWSNYSRATTGTNGRRKTTSDNTVTLPKFAQSPLLNESDFRYFSTKPIWDAETSTLTEEQTTGEGDEAIVTNAIATNANFDDLLNIDSYTGGDIYVRYTYERTTSPLRVGTLDDYLKKDDTDNEGIDLSGETWYNLADMFRGTNNYVNNTGGFLYTTSTNKFGYTGMLGVGKQSGFTTLSAKNMLWRLEGNDPYAIRIYNSYKGDDVLLTIHTSDSDKWTKWEENATATNPYKTFMYMNAFANDERGGQAAGYPYWHMLLATGSGSETQYMPLTGYSSESKNFDAERSKTTFTEVRNNMLFCDRTLGNYYIAFFRANVSRLYRFHAMNCTTGTPVESWTATLKHDWLKPLILEDAITRRYAYYEQKHLGATETILPNTWKTQEELEALENAQFYHDSDLSVRVYDDINDKYDVYPEIEPEAIYDIYFKYQPMTNEEIQATEMYNTLPFQWSEETDIAADVDYHLANGKLEKGKMEANWYFMVLDTDEGVTTTTESGTKTRVGNQYFLCREDEGTVDWMDNAFALHKDSEDNYSNYSYNRLAEWYKYGDNDAFREGRWLWAFVGGDPYNAKVVNMEARTGVTPLSPLGAYSLAKQDESCVTVSTTITDGTYPAVRVSDDTSVGAYQWGLAPGYGTEQTLSLVSSTLLPEDSEKANVQLYWTMVNKKRNSVTTDSVALAPRAQDRSNAIQLLPYEPTVYQDINLAIRRDDEVGTYLTTYPSEKNQAYLDAMKTGTVYMFFAAESREYAEGDIITSDNMPLIVKRQFCDYTFYSDDFRTPGSYTVKDGPYRYEKQTETITVDGTSITKTKFDDYGNILYTYKYNVDNEDETPLSTPQTVYIKYKVTSDIFLKKHPNKAEVAEMTANNDHVYFMDFTDNLTAEGYDKGHHAYFDEEATFQEQIGTVHHGTSEKQIWNGSDFVDDTNQPYNFCQFKTTTNRMESVPENLKWYFVGDPYAVQVYCTEDEFNTEAVTIDGHTYAAGELASNLCRFDPTESKFQFVVDCVHLRTPAAEPIDKRAELDYHDPLTNEVIAGQSEDNPYYGKPYYRPFYWEVVPAYSDRDGSFALRFKASNTVLGYRNVYYYLSHDGKTRTYKESIEEDKKVYKVNLSYNEENAKLLTSTKYRGYHKANDKDCVIHLVHPAKLYVSAYKENYSGEPVVKEELSEYFGLGEQITDVPRHLKRKYVKYNDWQFQTKAGGWHDESLNILLNKEHAYNIEDCRDCDPQHTIENGWVFCEEMKDAQGKDVPTKARVSFKLRVTYELDDETQNGIHLFTSDLSNPTWLDVKVGNNGTSGWLYYDKTNKGTDGAENQTTLLSNFGYSNVAGQKDGWSTGLKGLHWAFVGDPYNFTVVNRRRYDDRSDEDKTYWLGTHYDENIKTEKVRTGRDTETGKFIEEDKYVTYDYLRLGNTDVNGTLCTTTYDGKSPYEGINGEGGTGANGNTTWSLNYCKTGGDNDFFMRSASLKTNSPSELVGDYANKYVDATNKLHNETNDYERLIAKAFTGAGGNSGFVTTPFSLDTKTNKIDKVTIRTVTELDNDGAANDCFDANVRIYNENGEQKAVLKHVEVVYGDVFDAMPYTLRRYGCTYTDCHELYYSDYTTADLSNLNNITKKESFLTDKSPARTFSTATLDPTNWLITDGNNRRYIEVAYTYKVNEDAAIFFTTAEAESMDDYTWTNPYYRWTETHPGGKTSYPDYISVFDHYVYSPDGHIIDEVYRQELGTKTSDGKPYTTTDYGWINSHTGSQNAYGNETTQDESDQQKWAFIGDPYSFELKNYAEYLEKAKSTLNYTDSEEQSDEITFSTSGKTHWAIMQGDQETNIVDGETVKVTDKDGNPVYLYYLALIDDDETSPTYGGAIKFVTFERPEDLKDYKQYLYTKGGADLDYPTGNVYNTTNVKPFYISELASYANLIVYHLVIAHQYSRDPKDIVKLNESERYEKNVWATINNGTYQDVPYNVMDHLAEWDWYNNRIEGKDRNEDYPLSDGDMANLGDKYIKPSSLRDVISDPIPDYTVQRVGIGNRLSVPWYMQRQFCTYDLYQRDVMRSVTNYEDPALEEADAEWTGSTVTINGVEYKVDPTSAYTVDVNVEGTTYKVVQKTFVEDGVTKRAYNVKWESVLKGWDEEMDEASKPRGYDAVKAQNSHLITRLDDSHRNRMVIIDVVYHVNPEEFRFADKRRNTTAWYSMMTDNPKDGLMNFSYKDGVGARHGREKHYTNNYLWAPEGDPYGFVLHSRYATINGTGWDNVVVTTTGQLPTDAATTTVSNITKDGSDYTETTGKTSDVATYTGALSDTRFTYDRIMHRKKGEDGAVTWAARNAVYEMFTGSASNLFLMHPTSAYIDISTDKFSSFYMVHNTTKEETNFHKAELKYEADVKTLRNNPDANWRLYTTPEQLLPYFERAGYVGGLVPTIANHYENIALYNTLTDYKQKYRTDPSVIDFKVIDKARELVYGGKFYTRSSNGSYTDELPYNTDRPTDSDKLPLKFVSNNLVPLQQGYYRIEAFSDNALNADGRNVDGTGEVGIIGPRYISGYRHQSEKDYEGYDGSTLKEGSRWLHFYETDEAHTTFHTFRELNSVIGNLNSEHYHNRDIQPHPALRGNNEILPAEYDPSSIFFFKPAEPQSGHTLERYDRYTFGTQNLWVRGRAGGVQGTDYEYDLDPSINPDATFGITKLVDNLTGTTSQGTQESTGTFDDRFRMDDIGGTAFTFRILSTDTGSSPDKEIEENIKTNYLCIDANHRYRITIHTDNEMKEIGDSYDHLNADDYWQLDDINYGIQDTKWLLKPVGTRTEWPYNEMPLRLKVNKGGVKKEYYETNADGSVKCYESGTKAGQPIIDETLTCVPENVDENYYASLYVPFDTRLNSTLDVAFTNIKTTPQPYSLTLSAVSQLNGMGNPQFIPAEWPVIIRSSKPKTGTWMKYQAAKDTTRVADPSMAFKYVELNLPNRQTTSIPEGKAKIQLEGEYLEKEVTAVSGNVMVFGLPFTEDGTKTDWSDNDDGNSKSYYAYDDTKGAVGFYTNENWWRGHTDTPSAGGAENIVNDNTLAHAHWSTARNATSQQRNNLYVYHNKAYFVYATGGGAKPRLAVIFDGDTEDTELTEDTEEEEAEQPDFTEKEDTDPWPCDVYDLQGRRVAVNETPQSLRRNHPGLPRGVYIFGHKKVIVK